MQASLERNASIAIDFNTRREYSVGRARQSVLLGDGLSYVPGTQKTKKISLSDLTSDYNTTFRSSMYTELWSNVCTRCSSRD